MPALTINGITIPILAEGADETPMEQGERTRAASGKLLTTVVRRWRERSFKLLALTDEDAVAYEGLIAGKGLGCSFDADLYTDATGLQPTTTGTTPTVVATDGAVSPKYGAKMLKVPASATARWTHSIGETRYSACVWVYVSGAWHHYAIRSDTMATGHYYDGSWVASTQTLLTASSLYVQLGAGAGAAVQFDDLVSVPYLLPTTWIAAIAAQAVAFPKPPMLTVAGDLITQGGATYSGTVSKVAVKNRGALAPGRELAFKLEEI